MADQDDWHAPAAQPLDQGEHLAGFADAQRRGGLVQDDDPGAERGRAGDRDGLALPAGQGLHLLGDVLDRADPEVLELLPGLGPHAAGVEHAEDPAQRALVPDLAAEVEVAGDIQGGGDREGLVHGLDPGLPGIGGALELDPGPVQHDLALIRAHRAGQALDQRGLAGAVVADDGQHLARVQLQAHPGQPDHVAERLDQAARFECRRARPGGHAVAARVGRVYLGTHRLTFLIHWSSATATMTRMPSASTW